MNTATREDYYWLVSSDAAPLIKRCQEAILDKTNVVRIAKSLRKQTTPARSAIILELAQLRIKARKKFPFAEEMFLTRKGYEQATSALIAEYKAKRFAKFERIADICCGIGGDLMYLANRDADCETVGVDTDPLVCLYAQQNLVAARVAGHAEIVESDFDDYNLSSFEAVHIDPDRRAHGRTVQSNFFSPSIAEIFNRLSSGNLAIKMAPASPEPGNLPNCVEREWIGDRRECKQQVLWCGETVSRPGALTATCVNRDGSVEQISVGIDEIDQTIVVAEEIGQYIFEPHPSVLAAKLTDTIGNRCRLARLAPTVAYLTGNNRLSTSLLTRYKVIRVTTLNTRIVANELSRLDVGQIEVKNRGAEKLLTDQFARMKLDGSKRLTVLLTRHKQGGIAIIAQRQSSRTL